MQGESPHVRVKEPYSSFHSAKLCVQCTPARYPREILQIGTLTGGLLCSETHPLCRLKNPTVVYMISCRLSLCKTGLYNVRLLIILERGCSSIYRKKDSISYMLRAVTSFLKAVLVKISLILWNRTVTRLFKFRRNPKILIRCYIRNKCFKISFINHHSFIQSTK